MKATLAGKRYDVVIVNVRTRIVASVIGENLNKDRAEKRLETGIGRINPDYFVDIVTAGKFKVGDSHRRTQ